MIINVIQVTTEDNRRESGVQQMSLPPTSPFDNFLKAAGGAGR